VDLDLAGRRVAITGGTRGIGAAIAAAFADEGAAVALCARDGDAVEEAVAGLAARGVPAWGRPLDVADGPALQAFVDDAAAELGGLDVFVANASGVMGRGLDDEAWQRGLDVDILGTVRGCEAALPHLERSGVGAVVVVGSIAALEVTAGRRAYSSIKAALYPYVKTFARDVGPRGVRANLVSPGQIFFEGGIWDRIRVEDPERYASALAANPTGRLGTPEEVAAAVVFLASPRASFVSGTNLVVDGARMYRMPI
jgi:3-oxoacyl-[acyl-carrier protein] reductase